MPWPQVGHWGTIHVAGVRVRLAVACCGNKTNMLSAICKERKKLPKTTKVLNQMKDMFFFLSNFKETSSLDFIPLLKESCLRRFR